MTRPTMIAITGYASLDHVAMLDGVPHPGRTTTILDRPGNAWPRLGGSPAYVAAALVGNGIAAAYPVSWIGADEAGLAYRAQLAAKGVACDGLETVAGARTPIAILAYEPLGGCLCLYHPGMPRDLGLSESQRRLIAAADWLCVTIGPPDATAAALDAMSAAARLAWVVKDDPRAMPPQLARRLGARAELVCCSQAERAFLAEALGAPDGRRNGQIVIETHGRTGAAYARDGISGFVAATPLAASDPTGAGDSFAGGALAALANGETDIAAAVEAGHRAAAALLAGRIGHETESA